MKRIGLIGVCFGMVLLLTGCGEKRLECTRSEDNMEQVINFKFNSNDVFESGSLRQTVKLDEDELDTLDEGVEYMKEYFSSSEFEGLDIKVSDNGKDEVYVDMAFDADELSEATGAELGEDDNYDSAKETFEGMGYVCE